MSTKPKKPDASPGAAVELEDEAPALPPNPDLEAALQEAADSLTDRGTVKDGEEDPPKASEVKLIDPALDESYDEEIERLRDELIAANDKYMRLQADFTNFRKRASKERQELLQFGHENLVKDLLSTVDNLDRAIDHAQKSDGGDLESLLQGVALLQRELLGVLEQHEVKEIEARGLPFDPALHEAMAQVPDDSVPPNTVIEVLQKGYQLRGRLLRAARVVVAKASEKAGGEENKGGGAGQTG